MFSIRAGASQGIELKSWIFKIKVIIRSYDEG